MAISETSLLRHPAWKRRGPILISALHTSVTYLFRQLPTYLQPRTHTLVDFMTQCEEESTRSYDETFNCRLINYSSLRRRQQTITNATASTAIRNCCACAMCQTWRAGGTWVRHVRLQWITYGLSANNVYVLQQRQHQQMACKKLSDGGRV